MGFPFDKAKWRDAIVLDTEWAGAPGRSGRIAMAILETARDIQFWQWDDEVLTRPRLLARHSGEYDVRRAARAMSAIQEGGACACTLSGIDVRGEHGWRADLLAIAWYRDGDNDCVATPLASILATLSDAELKQLRRQIGSLRNDDLIAISYRIGELREGTSSALSLIQDCLTTLSSSVSADRDEALESIEEKAEEWVRLERHSKFAAFSGQVPRCIELKELELLSQEGKRPQFAQRAARFRADLEHAIYVERDLSAAAKRALAAEKSILRRGSRLDDAFSREELEEMTNHRPPVSNYVRGRVLRAWSRADPLPSRFGSCVPHGIFSSDPFRFLHWLCDEDIGAVLSVLNETDPAGARHVVERVLRLALPSAQRIATPASFSGANAAMARGFATTLVRTAREVEVAARACGIEFDPELELPVAETSR